MSPPYCELNNVPSEEPHGEFGKHIPGDDVDASKHPCKAYDSLLKATDRSKNYNGRRSPVPSTGVLLER